MPVVLQRLRTSIHSMWLLLHRICNMEYVYITNTFTESSNYMTLTHKQKAAIDEFELNDLNSLFLTNELSLNEQRLFLYIIRGAELQDHYDLSQSVKYFEMEGLL